MTREQAIEIIMKYGSDSPKDSPAYRELIAFLETSPECRELHQRQAELWETLDLWKPVEPSADFDGRLFAKISARDAATPWYQQFISALRPSFAVGLAALLVAAATILRQQPGAAFGPELAEDARIVGEMERALGDMEMLAEFDVLPLDALGKDRS